MASAALEGFSKERCIKCMLFMLNSVVSAIDKIRRRFLWHGHKGQEGKYMSLVAWEIVIRPKEMGGMGVRNLYTLNKALLAKVMWQWIQIQKPDWMRIMSITEQSLRPWELHTATPFWKALSSIGDFMYISVKYKLGNGKHIKFWKDAWLSQPLRGRYQDVFMMAKEQDMSVHQAMNEGQWDLKLHHALNETETEQRDKLLMELRRITIEEDADATCWVWTVQSQFTVKSAYDAMEKRPFVDSEVKNIWKIKAPMRVRIFTWLALKNRILTVDNLLKRGWQMPNRCILCKAAMETVRHIFKECVYSAAVLTQVAQGMTALRQSPLFMQGDFKAAILTSQRADVIGMQVTMCFVIWRERCARIFREEYKPAWQLAIEIQQEYQRWFLTNQAPHEQEQEQHQHSNHQEANLIREIVAYQ